jgi:hypothetical protein
VKLTAKEQALILRKRHQQKVREIKPKVWVGREFPKAYRGRVREPGFLAYLRRLPCVAGLVGGCCEGPVEAAHIRFSDAAAGRINSGMQCKPSDRWATPLCRHHHQHDQHTRSERAFWEGLGIEPGALSTALYEAYQAGADGLAVLQAFAIRSAA